MTTPITSRSELTVLPAILAAIAAGIAVGFAVFLSWPVAALFVATLPLPLFVLWIGRDVPAPLDRIAAVDAERAAERAQGHAHAPVAAPLARAA